MAGRLDWGHNQGTDFVTSPCNHWKGAYRCNTTQLSGCTYNREAEGYCPIVSYFGDLPQHARYFPQVNKGGQSSFADYCTYFLAYSDGSCTDSVDELPTECWVKFVAVSLANICHFWNRELGLSYSLYEM